MRDPISLIVFFFVGFSFLLIGIAIGYNLVHNEYKKCRYYGQNVEFCAKEIGWEK